METTTPLDLFRDALWQKRAKTLGFILFTSVALNVILGLALFSRVLGEDVADFFEKGTKSEASSQERKSLSSILAELSTIPFAELVEILKDHSPVGQGYRRCDLACSCLVAYHHFDIHKALGGIRPQNRDVTFGKALTGETIDIALFPGLTDAQLQAICHFATTEQWPLTTQGLFLELKGCSSPLPTLLESFYATAEFQALYLYLQRAPRPISRKALSEMLITADYAQFEKFALRIRKDPILSPDFRFELYRNYLNAPSKIAAYMLLENDEALALERLLDREVSFWLQLIPTNHPKLESLCYALLKSPRSDEVWRHSALGLLKIKDLPVPTPYNHGEALRLLFPEAIWRQTAKAIPTVDYPISNEILTSTPSVADIPRRVVVDEVFHGHSISEKLPPRIPSSQPLDREVRSERTHLVQEGESLWKISRKYKVSVEKLMDVNKLGTEKIHPGKTLIIPAQ